MDMEKKKTTWGGVRPGAGRPVTNERNKVISIRISPAAYEIYKRQTNKAEFIDNLILRSDQ